MRKWALVWVLALTSAIASASEEIVYCAYHFDSETLPDGFLTYDVDDQPLHYSGTQYGFEQGVGWMGMREENVYPYNYFAASFSRHKAKSGASQVLATEHWLVMPAVFVRHSSANLSWRSNTISLNLEETSTYSIRVSTAGALPENFTDAPLLTVNSDSLDHWTQHQVSLASYAGKQVYIAFVNTTYQGETLAIDDIIVQGRGGDFSFTTNAANYICGVKTFTPAITFTQLSSTPTTSFTAHCEDVASGEVLDTTVTNLNLSQGDSIVVPFKRTYQVANGDTLSLRIWLTVKGSNTDVMNTQTVFLSFLPEQHVVIETGTGNWCGWCPQGIVAIQRIREKYGETVLPISVHYNDLMQVEDYIGEEGIYFPGGYPSGHINRRWSTVPLIEVHEGRKSVWTTLQGGYETYVLKALEEKPCAEIELQAKASGNYIDIESATRFCIPQHATEYTVAYILTEDSWSNASVAQKNYISGQSYELDGWESKPSTIAGYVFKDVARGAAEGAFRGLDAGIPSEVAVDTPYRHEMLMEIPKAVADIQNCSLTAMLIDAQTGYIVNSKRVSLNPESGIEDVDANAQLQTLSPRPSATICNLSGQRLTYPRRGVNIINGRKILVP